MRYSRIHMKGLHCLLAIKKQIKHQPMGAVYQGHTYRIKSIQDYLKMEWGAFNAEVEAKYAARNLDQPTIERFGREILEKQWYVAYFNNSLIHYYVETAELFDFLCDTSVHDFSAVYKALEESPSQVNEYDVPNAVLTTEGHLVPAGKNKEPYIFGAIHHCRTENSVAFAIRKTATGAYHLLLHYGTGWAANCFDSDFYKMKFEDHATNGGSYTKSCNLIANLFLYAATFPDMIRVGVPNDTVLSYNATRHQSRTIGAAEEVIDRSGVTPHFRRGHFRLLSSEHWTKKRGQIVFVRATFVKGHAETVEDVGAERVEMLNE